MQPLPSIKQLQYLKALAAAGSFSLAARHCHVTQSTLSAGIAALEDLLGHAVIDRSQHRRASLTQLGRDVLTRTDTILDEAAAIMDRARSLGQPLSGPLRMGVIPTIAPYWLPQILPVLAQDYPQLELQLYEDLTERLLASLKAGRVDILLIALPYRTPGMRQETLFSEPFRLACPRHHWRGPKPVPVAQLKGEDLLLLEDGHCLRDHAMKACRLQPTAEKRAFSATSLPTLIEMVRHGYGVTILPAMAASALAGAADIDIIDFKTPAPARDIGMVWRNGHPRQDEFIALARHLKKITNN